MKQKDFEIFCPKCGWRPGPEDRWSCEPACGTVWNTFWTRGLCPGCGKQWEQTQCLACGEFSPHRRWYHRPSGKQKEDRAPSELEPVDAS